MSSVRNRSQSHFSPQVNQRVLQHDLEGASEALAAFDGFESAGPVLQSSVLQRPKKWRLTKAINSLTDR